jgi:hypothetical protein
VNDVNHIRSVAARQRAQLLARAEKLADKPDFVAGLAWAVSALDRVIRACDGEPDIPVRGRDRRHQVGGELEGQMGMFGEVGA